MSAGMECLVEKLGIVGAEMFLPIVREQTAQPFIVNHSLARFRDPFQHMKL
jgi:hypothetical protein